MRERFFEPGAFAEFCAGFTEELNRLRREHRMQLAAAPREIAGIKRRAQEILKLLLEGFRNEEWKDELRQLDERRAELEAAIAASATDPAQPALHPQMAEVFQQRTTLLAAALEHDEERDAARQALRGFLEKIVIPPGPRLSDARGSVARSRRRGAAAYAQTVTRHNRNAVTQPPENAQCLKPECPDSNSSLVFGIQPVKCSPLKRIPQAP